MPRGIIRHKSFSGLPVHPGEYIVESQFLVKDKWIYEFSRYCQILRRDCIPESPTSYIEESERLFKASRKLIS